jgi:hypothetical protein
MAMNRTLNLAFRGWTSPIADHVPTNSGPKRY